MTINSWELEETEYLNEKLRFRRTRKQNSWFSTQLARCLDKFIWFFRSIQISVMDYRTMIHSSAAATATSSVTFHYLVNE